MSKASRHMLGRSAAGREIFEVHPIILGGSPTDPANKVVLDRSQHVQAVRYWNRLLREKGLLPRR